MVRNRGFPPMSDKFDLSAFLPYRLAVLSERVSKRLAVEYERLHGLSVAEWRVLVHVQRLGTASVRDIHARANLDKPRVSRAVSRLEKAGFVAKKAGGQDARLVRIELTAAGQKALAEIIPIVREIEARLLAALSPAEIESLRVIEEKLHATLDSDPVARPRT